MKTKQFHEYLTTHQAILKVTGFLKPIEGQDEETRYALNTLKGIFEKHGRGYYSFNKETGSVEIRINHAGLADLWAIMARIEVHTTNH